MSGLLVVLGFSRSLWHCNALSCAASLSGVHGGLGKLLLLAVDLEFFRHV